MNKLKATTMQGASCAEMMKKIGEMWHALSDQQKQPYNKMSEQDRQRYETEKQGESGKKKGKGKKEGGEKKKGNVTSFVLFCKEKRPIYLAENPQIKVTEISIKAGQEWKKMTDAEKNRYKQMAEQINSGQMQVQQPNQVGGNKRVIVQQAPVGNQIGNGQMQFPFGAAPGGTF